MLVYKLIRPTLMSLFLLISLFPFRVPHDLSQFVSVERFNVRKLIGLKVIECFEYENVFSKCLVYNIKTTVRL